MRDPMSASVLQPLMGPSVEALSVSFRSKTELKKKKKVDRKRISHWSSTWRQEPDLFYYCRQKYVRKPSRSIFVR